MFLVCSDINQVCWGFLAACTPAASRLAGAWGCAVATQWLLPTPTHPRLLQVVAGICPFNFPAMVPLWMFPMAVTAGNTFVLKPSEKDPGAAMMLADLAQQAGLPK